MIRKKTAFLITNFVHKVSLHSSKSKLPEEWGFNMKQISGKKKSLEQKNSFTIQKVDHPKIIVSDIPKKIEHMPFLSKFFELLKRMISSNNSLTNKHPYQSDPITWPFVIRGISFWEKAEGLKQIYLIGNPFVCDW